MRLNRCAPGPFGLWAARASWGALAVLAGGIGCDASPPDLSGQEYYSVRRDLRRCVSPLCGGYFLKALNQQPTRCADGSTGEECYVASADFGFLGSFSLEGGVSVVRGALSEREYEGFGSFGHLLVREAWAAEGVGEESLTFYRLADNGIRCVTTPCFSTDAETLNLGRVETLSNIDLEPARLEEPALERAAAALAEGRLLINGLAAPVREGSALAALNVYLPLGTTCESDDACGDGQRCNAADACFPPPQCRAGEDCPAVCSGYCTTAPDQCTTATDCGDRAWCRYEEAGARCAPFVGEGDGCEGFTLPRFFERCAPGLSCDLQDPTGDTGGVCRVPCESDRDCRPEQYCAGDELCHEDGSCESLADCSLPGNVHLLPACVGERTCSALGEPPLGVAEGVCGIDCGAPPVLR